MTDKFSHGKVDASALRMQQMQEHIQEIHSKCICHAKIDKNIEILVPD